MTEPLICSRCSHDWLPRWSHLPKQCPNCHSPYWDKPLIRRSKLRKPELLARLDELSKVKDFEYARDKAVDLILAYVDDYTIEEAYKAISK